MTIGKLRRCEAKDEEDTSSTSDIESPEKRETKTTKMTRKYRELLAAVERRGEKRERDRAPRGRKREVEKTKKYPPSPVEVKPAVQHTSECKLSSEESEC
jgi:hypothetical protein